MNKIGNNRVNSVGIRDKIEIIILILKKYFQKIKNYNRGFNNFSLNLSKSSDLIFAAAAAI